VSFSAGLTEAGIVYQALRRDIVRGILEPEGKLHIKKIGWRYGCGPIPARDVLSRSVGAWFVQYSEQRGFAVVLGIKLT
jgi:GntR family transcriptional regulator, carbon starvation induced regulator